MPSTAIRYIDYNSTTQDLRVTFTTGRRYVYAQVPADIHAAFRDAPSRGAYFNAHLRDAYPFHELARSGRKSSRDRE